jgi:hypothetical protein
MTDHTCCTCRTDIEMCCIVHPHRTETEEALYREIAYLKPEAMKIEFLKTKLATERISIVTLNARLMILQDNITRGPFLSKRLGFSDEAKVWKALYP